MKNFQNYIFFIDFDGTIASEDVCYSMVEKYARDGWQKFNKLWEEKSISTVECAQGILNTISAHPEEMETFFAQMKLDEYFKEFQAWAKNNNYPIYILSDGYERYIRLILEKEGVCLPYFSNKLIYEPKQGWRMETPYLNEACGQCGVCKSNLLQERKKHGAIHVYIGDGYSDICPIKHCDIIFAKNNLANYCKKERISFNYFDDFSDILKLLKKDDR